MCDSAKKNVDKVVVKKVKQAHTLNLKLEVLRRFDAGEKSIQIARALKLPPSTVRSFKRFREKLKAVASSGNVYVTRSRSEIMEKMEKLLLIWIDVRKQNNLRLSKMIIQEKAKSLYNELKEERGENSQTENFLASRGWFNRFKHRSRLQNVNIIDEVDNMDDEVAEKIPDILQCTIEEGSNLTNHYMDVDGMSEPLKNLTVEHLSQVFSKLDEIIQILNENDPNNDRSSMAIKSLTDSVHCYKNIYQLKNKKYLQMCLGGLFKRETECDPCTSENQIYMSEYEGNASNSASHSKAWQISESITTPSCYSDEELDGPVHSSPSSR